MKRFILLVSCILLLSSWASAVEINRVGSTAASFLEIGMGSAPSSMGEAYVAMTGDLSALAGGYQHDLCLRCHCPAQCGNHCRLHDPGGLW